MSEETKTETVQAIAARLLAEAERATPGPWVWWDRKTKDNPRPKKYDIAHLYGHGNKSVVSCYGREGLDALGRTPEDHANAALIASSRTGYPAALRAVALLAAALETAHQGYRGTAYAFRTFNLEGDAQLADGRASAIASALASAAEMLAGKETT